MSIKPIGGRVAVRHITEQETKRPSGIVLVDSAATGDGTIRAEVVAVGPGVLVKGERVPMSVTSGDTVMVPRYAGTEVEVGGEKWVIVNEADILAVVDDVRRNDVGHPMVECGACGALTDATRTCESCGWTPT